MTAQRYEIREAFRYTAATPEGAVAGEFAAGVTGDDLTDEQAEYLEQHAVPAGLAARVGDASAPPAPAPAPQEPAPVPSDTQEQAQ